MTRAEAVWGNPDRFVRVGAQPAVPGGPVTRIRFAFLLWLAVIGIAEKGSASIELLASGEGGHSSRSRGGATWRALSGISPSRP